MRNLIACIIACLVASIALLSAQATEPVRPRKPEAPSAPAPKRLPDLDFTCQFGKIAQSGNALQISGHPGWSALGEIRADGKIFLLWTRLGTGEPCPGLYVWNGSELNGFWGQGGAARIDEEGNLIGSLNAERLHKIAPELVPID